MTNIAEQIAKAHALEVIVGNIGTVYHGDNYMQAMAAYREYVRQSKANVGRAAGEPVTVLHRNEIKHEYEGTN